MRTTTRTTWLSAGLLGACVMLLCLERWRPLRVPVEPKLRRNGRNLVVAASSFLAVHLVEKPLARRLLAVVTRRRWGLLQQVSLPPWLHVLLAFALLDYTLYLWTVPVHQVPWLWRLHQVHHVDRDMDAVFTAVRFHGVEIALAIPGAWGRFSASGYRLWPALAMGNIVDDLVPPCQCTPLHDHGTLAEPSGGDALPAHHPSFYCT